MKTTPIFLALLGSLALLGCGPEDAGETRGGRQDVPDARNGNAQPAPTEAKPGCASDSDCGAGSGCALPGGVCVAFPTAEARFSVLVDPGEGSGLIPDQFAGLIVGAGGTVNVTLPEPLV
ncbi:MAG: hypothetical protein FJ087_22845, partial [Deltaproteobacteria bacterium]|nr:hypothetical protein [Deltaproteobacteria bacterium]